MPGIVVCAGETETKKTLSLPFIKAGNGEDLETENKQQINKKNNKCH